MLSETFDLRHTLYLSDDCHVLISASSGDASIGSIPSFIMLILDLMMEWFSPIIFFAAFFGAILKIFSSDLKKLGEKEIFYKFAALYWLRLVTLLKGFTKYMQLTITICSTFNATFARNKETRSENMCTLCTRNNFSIFTEKNVKREMDWLNMFVDYIKKC